MLFLLQQFEVGESVELVRGSGVYISSQKLDESLREAKNGTQLARKLMDAFWDKGTLARSSVSPRSKYQYQQLDPKITAAIESKMRSAAARFRMSVACYYLFML